MANSNAVTPPLSVNAPAMSNFCAGNVSVSGSTIEPSTKASAISGICAAKITRQPTVSSRKPPSTTPMTGPPAPTSDHQPIAFTRSWRSKVRITMAIDAAPVAAPSREPMVRMTISGSAPHASAEAPAAKNDRTSPYW